MVDSRTSQSLRHPLRLVAPIALAIAAGCSTQADFTGRDTASLMPTGRISFDLSGEPDADSDPIDAANRGPAIVAEVEGTQASGDFGSRGYDLTEATGGVRVRWIASGDFQISLLGGVAFTDAGLDQGGQLSVDVDDQNVGPYVGVEVRYISNDSFSVYGRAQNAFLLDDATSLRAELGAQLRLLGPVDLIGGYRWWRYVLDRGSVFSSDSDAELGLSGAFLGLGIDL